MGRRAGGQPLPSSACRCVYWGATAPQQLWLSQARTPCSNTILPTQPSEPAHWHRPVPDPTDPNTSPHPSLALQLPPRVLSGPTQWPRPVHASSPPHPRRHDVTWGRALRHSTGGGVRKGEAAELPEPGQSLTLWAVGPVGPGTDSAATPYPRPASHALGSAGSPLCAGGLPGTPASRL